MAAVQTITDEEIDALTLPKAVKICRDNGIKVKKEDSELYMMKYIIKFELLCKTKSRLQTVNVLTRLTETERHRKQALSEVYNETHSYVHSIHDMEQIAVQEIKTVFPSIMTQLMTEKEKVLDERAPVLVLGETGSGKSTFINLLLDENILPCSLLSNTHVICEIRYGPFKAELIKGDKIVKVLQVDEENDIELFKTHLGTEVESQINGKPCYDVARIYAECDILKCGMVIVDSPGVGETKEMEETVLSYVSTAAAFIYIIDSTNAGGMQERVENLVKDVYKRLTVGSGADQIIPYRPEMALFICNKWDEVEMLDRPAVLNDTRKKIQQVWKGCDNSQIIPFSTIEAMFMQERGVLSPKYDEVLGKIKILFPEAYETVIIKGYRFLDKFITQCRTIFELHIEMIHLGNKEREQKVAQTQNRLAQLNSKLDDFFKDQRKALEDDVEKHVKNLKQFLQDKKSMDAVCKFDIADLATETDWNKAAAKVRKGVYDGFREVIKDWEADKEITQGTLARIQSAIEKEFPAFEMEIYQIEQEMTGRSDASHPAFLNDDDDHNELLPEFLRDKVSMLSTGTRIALGIGLSPILLAGLVIRLPYIGFRAAERAFLKHRMESDFKAAVSDPEKMKKVCEEYSAKTMKSITDKISLKAIIEEDMHVLFRFLDAQKQRMKGQIDLDIKLLRKFKFEETEQADREKIYQPLNAKCKILSHHLKHFMLMYNPSYYLKNKLVEGVEVTESVICDGVLATLMSGTCTNNNGRFGNIVCVRKQKTPVKYSDVMKYLQALQAYSHIQEKWIVECIGFCESSTHDMMYQVFQPLQSSLRQYLLTLSTDFKNNRKNNVLRIMTSIVKGLSFLHDRHLVHTDLSLDTVAVDALGNVKLTNISVERDIELDIGWNTWLESFKCYIHFSPRLLFRGKQTREQLKYCARDDMYSIGILMWELWTEEDPWEMFPIQKWPPENIDTAADDLEQNVFQYLCGKKSDFANKAGIVYKKWFPMMLSCVDVYREITAKEWLKDWEGHGGYPPLTIVTQM